MEATACGECSGVYRDDTEYSIQHISIIGQAQKSNICPRCVQSMIAEFKLVAICTWEHFLVRFEYTDGSILILQVRHFCDLVNYIMGGYYQHYDCQNRQHKRIDFLCGKPDWNEPDPEGTTCQELVDEYAKEGLMPNTQEMVQLVIALYAFNRLHPNFAKSIMPTDRLQRCKLITVAPTSKTIQGGGLDSTAYASPSGSKCYVDAFKHAIDAVKHSTPKPVRNRSRSWFDNADNDDPVESFSHAHEYQRNFYSGIRDPEQLVLHIEAQFAHMVSRMAIHGWSSLHALQYKRVESASPQDELGKLRVKRQQLDAQIQELTFERHEQEMVRVLAGFILESSFVMHIMPIVFDYCNPLSVFGTGNKRNHMQAFLHVLADTL